MLRPLQIAFFALTAIANTAFAESGSRWSKEWTVDELTQPQFPERYDLGDKLKSMVVGFAKDLGAAQNKSDGSIYRSLKMDEQFKQEQWLWNLSAFGEVKKFNQGQETSVSTSLEKTSTQLITKYAGQRFRETIGSDLKFETTLSLRPSQPSSAAYKPNLQYGLLLQGIQTQRSGPSFAALGDSGFESLSSAGRSTPIWTIGPQDRQQPFNATVEKTVPSPNGYWFQNIDPSFSVKATPNLSAAAQQGTNLWNWNLSQSQGYYSLRNVQNKDKESAIEHQFKLPIVGELALRRTINQSGQITKNTAENLLVSNYLPTLNVSQFPLLKKWQAEAVLSDTESQTLKASAVIVDKESAGQTYKISYHLNW